MAESKRDYGFYLVIMFLGSALLEMISSNSFHT